MSIGYALISEFYGDRRAERSQVLLMNHIDEGISILDKLGAYDETKEAFAVHPLFQNDADLLANFNLVSKLNPRVVALAFEYRNVANAFLSHHMPRAYENVYLSPIEQVNEMLTADKVQNRKDFLRYHRGSHPNSGVLDLYFDVWLQALGITETRYNDLVRGL